MSAVEWKKLGDVCEIIKGCSLSKNDIGTGNCPVILYGELYTTYGDYITSIKSCVSSELAENATPLKYNDLVLPVSSTTKEAQIGKSSVIKVTTNVSLGSDAIILRNSPNSDYLMYYINSQLFEKEKMQCVNGTTIMHLSPKKMSEKKIPIPSLAKQQEIVSHLDTFTSLISNLESELDMRRKQYEHYRNQLLDLEGKEGVEIKKISDICSIIKGGYITKKETIPGNIPVILGGQEPAYYINVSNHEGKAIVISRSGASAGFVSFWDEPIFVTDGFLIEPKNEKLKIEYLYCSLKDRQQIIQSLKRGAGVPHITTNHINDLQIPIPSLTKQTEIVEKLDAFENLIQSLEQEIKLRKQQYEYYREKLLTFE